MAIGFIVDPVHYSYKYSYDLRGWTKYIAAFFAAFVGVLSIKASLDKRKRIKYYCPTCGRTGNFLVNSDPKCNHCKHKMELLDNLEL